MSPAERLERLKKLDNEAPILKLGSKEWQQRYMKRILGVWPAESAWQIQNDLMMLLSDPDSSPRMKRLMKFFLE